MKSAAPARPTGYVIIDPQHEYGVALVRHIERAYGLHPIVIYANSRVELHRRAHYPELACVAPLANYCLDQTPLAEVAADIAARFHVQGLVPFFEESIVTMAALQDHLQVRWNDAAVLRRFRDKAALKAHLRAASPSLALGYFRPVKSVDDAFAEPLPEHFIIKPADGAANRDIGFFSADAGREPVAQYFANSGGSAYTLEERFVGEEYAVNGQMDAAGEATVVNVLLYERISGNGKPNLYHRTHHVRQTEAAFQPLAAYAVQAMEASGLRRCPFHMELMLTADGPRLIEVGARMGGTKYAFMANDVHGGTFDIFAMAAHCYLFDTPYPGPKPTWDFYNQVSHLHLDGQWPRRERLYALSGVEAVEALPEFREWVVKPQVGALLKRTQDLYTVPYSFHLMGRCSREALVAVSETAKGLLHLNAAPQPLWRRAWLEAQARAHQVRLRLQYRAENNPLTAVVRRARAAGA